MPPVGKMALVPPEIRDELNAGLVGSAFGDLDRWTAWLNERGYSIGRSTVGEYSKGLKTSIEKALERARVRVETARALGGISDADKAALLEANEMVMLDKLMDLMDDWDSVGADTRPKALANLIRASADLGGSARGTAKWKAENERKIREEAANAAETVAKAEGVSPETIARIRREVLGMAA
jgi:hypothetical protein